MRLKSLARMGLVGTSLIAVVTVLGYVQWIFKDAAAQDASASTMEAPRFEVDPFWPKPMPNNWVLGQTIGVAVDSDDNIWIVHRGWDPAALDNTELREPLTGTNAGQVVSECCNPSPPIMQFDQEGNLLQAWGGPKEGAEYEWPDSNHGIAVDDAGNVYVGGNGGPDSHVLKFTNDGTFIDQWGKKGARLVEAEAEAEEADADYAGVAPSPGEAEDAPEPTYAADSNDMESFGRVAKIDLVQGENEAYLSDGYLNHRVAVVDMDSGEIKRYWGAYGEPPTDDVLPPYSPDDEIARQFRNPVHCSNVSNDGLVYVCDRANDRIQVFQTDGTFVKEVLIAPETLAEGSVWDVDFSEDPEQKFLYVADGANEHIRVFDRGSMEELYAFGTGGRQPGMFLGVHSIAVDSQGNIYTTETFTGKRLQRFVKMGLAPAAELQVAWPM